MPHNSMNILRATTWGRPYKNMFCFFAFQRFSPLPRCSFRKKQNRKALCVCGIARKAKHFTILIPDSKETPCRKAHRPHFLFFLFRGFFFVLFGFGIARLNVFILSVLPKLARQNSRELSLINFARGNRHFLTRIRLCERRRSRL